MDEKITRLAEGFSGRFGVRFSGINTDFEYSRGAGELYSAASTVKLFCLGLLLQLCEANRLSLSQKIVLKPEYFEASSGAMGERGVLRELSFGDVLTVRDIAAMMIIYSDNSATNIIIDMIGGVEKIKEHLGQFGIVRSAVNRRLSEDSAVYSKSNFGDATPDDFVKYLKLIYSGKVLSREYIGIFYELMLHQHYKNFFPRYLPLKENYENGSGGNVTIANKTGWQLDARADVGYLTVGSKMYAYAVLADGCRDLSNWSENEGSLLIARIGRIFYDEVCN